MPQLPSSALPIAPSDPDGLSPLADYLRGFHSSGNGNSLHYDLVLPVMKGALALATQFPFDPNERIAHRTNGGEASTSLLEVVLRMTNVHQRSSEPAQWPEQITEFGPALLNASRDIDTEWVAAVLVAAGANPWKEPDLPQDQLPHAVVLATRYGLSGLLERFLECPGAWPAQKIADFVVPSATYSGASELMWSILCTDQHALPSLEVLLKAGARPPTKAATITTLSEGLPKAVEILSKFDLAPLSENDKSKISTQWKDRCKRHQITPAAVEKMAQTLWGEGQSMGLSSTDVETSKFLSIGWKSSANGSASRSYDFLPNKGAEALNSRGTFKGAVSGQWSLLAAAAFSRIKQADYTGCLGWSIPIMLFQEFSQEKRAWQGPDCSKPPYLNSLAPAIGFDWRPGVSIDGIVALSLFGQRSLTDAPQDKQVLARDIADFGLAAGIENPAVWAKSNMSAAVEFTTVALKRGTQDSIECFLPAWQTALEREPSLLDGLTQTDRLRLLGAIAQPTINAWDARKKAFQALSSVLFPGLNEKSLLEDATLRGIDLSAALLLSFVHMNSADLDNQIETIFDFSTHFDRSNMSTIKQWVEKSEPAAQGKWKAHIAQWELNQDTAVPKARSRSPRL